MIFSAAYAEGDYRKRLEVALQGVEDEDSLLKALRLFRRREMVRIAWRDLAAWADLAETLADLSALAAACVDCALRRLDELAVTGSGRAARPQRRRDANPWS